MDQVESLSHSRDRRDLYGRRGRDHHDAADHHRAGAPDSERSAWRLV